MRARSGERCVPFDGLHGTACRALAGMGMASAAALTRLPGLPASGQSNTRGRPSNCGKAGRAGKAGMALPPVQQAGATREAAGGGSSAVESHPTWTGMPAEWHWSRCTAPTPAAADSRRPARAQARLHARAAAQASQNQACAELRRDGRAGGGAGLQCVQAGLRAHTGAAVCKGPPAPAALPARGRH